MKAQLGKQGKTLRFIIVDLSPVTDIDASAVHFLMVRRFSAALGLAVLCNLCSCAILTSATFNCYP